MISVEQVQTTNIGDEGVRWRCQDMPPDTNLITSSSTCDAQKEHVGGRTDQIVLSNMSQDHAISPMPNRPHPSDGTPKGWDTQ